MERETCGSFTYGTQDKVSPLMQVETWYVRKKCKSWILTLTIWDRLFQRIMIIWLTSYLFTVVLSTANTMRWYNYWENFPWMIDCIIPSFTQSPCKSATLLTPVRQDKTLAWLVVPPSSPQRILATILSHAKLKNMSIHENHWECSHFFYHTSNICLCISFDIALGYVILL